MTGKIRGAYWMAKWNYHAESYKKMNLKLKWDVRFRNIHRKAL